MNRIRFALLALPFALIGCSGDESELSKEQQKDLSGNMSRSLTPEEIAKMGGGGAQGGSREQPPADAATPPPKNPGG